jgi:hypothetical protein
MVRRMDLSIKAKIINLLEGNTAEYLLEPGKEKDLTGYKTP